MSSTLQSPAPGTAASGCALGLTASLASSPIRLGIIGCGNMGGALAVGVQNSSCLRSAFTLHVYARREERAKVMQDIGAVLVPTALALAEQSDVIILAVKPYQIASVLQDILPALQSSSAAKKLVVSVAAGVTLAALQGMVNNTCPVARVMPNTLVAVGKGLFGVCFDNAATESQLSSVRALFSGMGRVVELTDDKMNAFSALAGCGPAYVFHFMESLAEAGVSMGLTRESSLSIAVSLLGGSTALAEQTAAHPAVLREQVTSPGGTTIAAINHLDRSAVRGHTIDAVLAAFARGKARERGE